MKILVKLISLKFLAAVLGVLYTILQVRLFGASRDIEIFFAAQSLVYLVTSMTQSGQLAEVFLPVYHKLNNIRSGLGYLGLNVVINRMLIYGGILIILIFVLAPFFIQLLVPGFSENDQLLATLIFRVLLPYLFFQLMNSFFISVLNAEKRFGRSELVGLSNTAVSLIILVLFFPIMGLWALVASLLIGKTVEFVFYANQLYKKGFKFRRILSFEEFNHKMFFKTMRNTLMYVGSTQIYSFVLTASISFLPEGTFAIFKYVQNLANRIRGLFVQPFITIFFTNYSYLLQRSQIVLKEFNQNIKNILNVNVIIIIGTILIGDTIIDLIWGGDKFGPEEVALAYVFLLFNVAGVLLSSIGTIYRKMSVANGKAKILYKYWTFSQLLSALTSYFLIKIFNVQGLFWIIPINICLLSVVSFMVYLKTKNALSINLINKDIFIGVLLVLSGICYKILINPEMLKLEFSFKVISTLGLLLIGLAYPLYSIYITLKEDPIT